MKSKAKWALAVAGILVGIIAWAQTENSQLEKPVGPEPAPQPEFNLPGEYRDLALTEDQKSAIKAVMLKTGQAVLPLQNQLGEQKARLKTLMTTEGSSVKSINKVAEKIGSLRTDMMKKKLAARLEARTLLNPTQKLAFDRSFEPGPRHRHKKHKAKHKFKNRRDQRIH